jgi:sortase A
MRTPSTDPDQLAGRPDDDLYALLGQVTDDGSDLLALLAPAAGLDTLPNGHATARRTHQRKVTKSHATGRRLQRTGAVATVIALAWWGVGDTVVGRWQQYELRAELADRGAVDFGLASIAGPVLQANGASFGLGGGPVSAAQATLIVLPGEDDVEGPNTAASPDAQPDASQTFRLQAPSIGLDWVTGVGVSTAHLKRGPGWMPGTAPPGAGGNTVISGHRTTYGAPFNRIDELTIGARITVDLGATGQAVYEVKDRFVVTPDMISVAYPTDASVLTLTTCTPTGSAKYRLVVQAVQVSGPGTRADTPFVPFSGERIEDPTQRD